MLPLRERIFPDVDCNIESNPMWISTIARKKHTDGFYYLHEIKVSIDNLFDPQRAILTMINQFNYMVFMFLTFSPVDPDAVNVYNGAKIFYKDPDQTDDLERVFKVTDKETV